MSRRGKSKSTVPRVPPAPKVPPAPTLTPVAKAPPPESRAPRSIEVGELPNARPVGYADGWAISDEGLFCRLQLQTSDTGGDSFQALVTVVVPLDDLLTSLHDNAGEFRDRVGPMYAAAGISPTQPRELISGDPPASLAQIIRIARVGLDGLLEFYAVHTYSLIKYGKGGLPPEVSPLFAIQVPTEVILGILDHVNERAAKIRERLSKLPPGVA